MPVRRELIWAAGVGIFLGLVIAFGVWRINFSSKTNSAITQAQPTPVSSSEFKIALNKPEDLDVVTENTVTVSGITKALSWIVVSGEKGDYIIQSGDNGIFSQDVDLISGVNQIKITAFDPNGTQSIEKVIVVYSSAFQPAASPSPTPLADASAESSIRQKVAEKVAEALNKPKAYIGVVTDIADSTIQIKTQDSQIQQISVSSDGITFVNQKGTNNKVIKLTDLAIGDFIVAMGYVNSKSVLAAQRILVTDPISESKLDVEIGKVTNVGKKTIDVSLIPSEQSQTLTPTSKTVIRAPISGKPASIKTGNINAGDVIIFVIDSTGTTPILRSIFQVKATTS